MFLTEYHFVKCVTHIIKIRTDFLISYIHIEKILCKHFFLKAVKSSCANNWYKVNYTPEYRFSYIFCKKNTVGRAQAKTDCPRRLFSRRLLKFHFSTPERGKEKFFQRFRLGIFSSGQLL